MAPTFAVPRTTNALLWQTFRDLQAEYDDFSGWEVVEERATGKVSIRAYSPTMGATVYALVLKYDDHPDVWCRRLRAQFKEFAQLADDLHRSHK
jgi:hypothetical protein